MRGRLWLEYFTYVIDPEYHKCDVKGKEWTHTETTEFMMRVLDCVAEKMNCHVARRRSENKEGSGEYLNIDAVFIDLAEYDLIKEEKNEWDPFVLPRAVVEHENSYNTEKISYSLWKILCVRAPIRVLICYQNGRKEVATLKDDLENVIWKGSLMKGNEGDLLVAIGDNSLGDEAMWGEYFTVFEWRNDRLEKIEGLEW